jgi:hypothetical protein
LNSLNPSIGRPTKPTIVRKEPKIIVPRMRVPCDCVMDNELVWFDIEDDVILVGFINIKIPANRIATKIINRMVVRIIYTEEVLNDI